MSVCDVLKFEFCIFKVMLMCQLNLTHKLSFYKPILKDHGVSAINRSFIFTESRINYTFILF